MLCHLTTDELSDGLDAVVAELLEQGGIPHPPVDAIRLAGALGLQVAVDDRQRVRARYVRLQGQRGRTPRPTILLRPEPRAERRQWAVAHEIGEHAAHQFFFRLAIDAREVDPQDREAVANWMAGRLLLPTAWFRADAAACGWDLFVLKGRYGQASHELIARRMLDFAPTVIVTVVDNGRVTFRGGNLAGPVPSLLAIEKDCQGAAHDSGRPQRASSGGFEVQAWPVHEEGWKREILRTEVGEEVAE